MPLQNSGAISMGDIRTEYGLTGAISLGSFRGDGSQPPLPSSGAISIGDFYSNIARSAKITVVHQNPSNVYAYWGYGEANMVSSNPTTAFGSITKNDLLVLGDNSKRITAVGGQAYPSTGTPRFNFWTASTVSTNSEFTTVTVCADLPTSASSNPVYTRNKTDSSYPNSFVSYIQSPPTIASEEQWQWNYQATPQFAAPTGGLHWNYFNQNANFGNGIGEYNITTTPIIFFV
jgi:hypothetical protein